MTRRRPWTVLFSGVSEQTWPVLDEGLRNLTSRRPRVRRGARRTAGQRPDRAVRAEPSERPVQGRPARSDRTGVAGDVPRAGGAGTADAAGCHRRAGRPGQRDVSITASRATYGPRHSEPPFISYTRPGGGSGALSPLLAVASQRFYGELSGAPHAAGPAARSSRVPEALGLVQHERAFGAVRPGPIKRRQAHCHTRSPRAQRSYE